MTNRGNEQSSMTNLRSKVVVVGAGPTGLTMALLLARSGIRCKLVEKNSATQSHPAACILNTRTMEVFREIGVDSTILERCQDLFDRANIFWVNTLSGLELGRCSPLPDDIASMLTLSPVHATHFPQNRLEPLLWQKVRDNPLIEFLTEAECIEVRQTDDGVECSIVGSNGAVVLISCDYLVACDGASSRIRHFIDVPTEGRVLQNIIGVYFTADLSEFVANRKGILYWTLNPEAFGVLIAHWLPEEWVLFVPYFPPQQSVDEFNPQRCRALVDAAIGVRRDDVRIRVVKPWALAARLATSYRRGRIFLAGDAAHSFPPTGGLGLNTGVQDAHNLAWKLTAVIKEVAGPGLLETYEQERRPVAKQNLEHSVRNFENMSDLLRVVGLDISHMRHLQTIQNASLFRLLPLRWQKAMVDRLLQFALSRLSMFAANNRDGATARGELSRRIPGQAAHYQFLGLDLGFTYDRGAFIGEFTSKPTARNPVIDYRPTTWPSARLPHFMIEKKGAPLSIHDALGRETFTLLVHARGAQHWRDAAAAINDKCFERVRCLSIGPKGVADLFDVHDSWTNLSEIGPTGAVLVRPDGHVAWRTDSLPESPTEELETIISRLLCLDATRDARGLPSYVPKAN